MRRTPYVFGVIPARGGSKGLPGKNLRMLGTLSLIGHAVASSREAHAADALHRLDRQPGASPTRRAGTAPRCRSCARPSWRATRRAWCRSSSTRCAGSRRRSACGPTSSSRSSRRRRSGSAPTSTRPSRRSIETGADSAQTVTEACYHPFFMKTLDGDRTIALFHDGHKYVRRQDAPPVYQPSGAVYVTRYDVLMHEAQVLGQDNRAVVKDFEASVNIDTEWDFLLAELLLREGRAPIPAERRLTRRDGPPPGDPRRRRPRARGRPTSPRRAAGPSSASPTGRRAEATRTRRRRRPAEAHPLRDDRRRQSSASGTPRSPRRAELFDRLRASGWRSPHSSIRAPRSRRSARVGQGSVVFPAAVLGAGVDGRRQRRHLQRRGRRARVPYRRSRLRLAGRDPVGCRRTSRSARSSARAR